MTTSGRTRLLTGLAVTTAIAATGVLTGADAASAATHGSSEGHLVHQEQQQRRSAASERRLAKEAAAILARRRTALRDLQHAADAAERTRRAAAAAAERATAEAHQRDARLAAWELEHPALGGVPSAPAPAAPLPVVPGRGASVGATTVPMTVPDAGDGLTGGIDLPQRVVGSQARRHQPRRAHRRATAPGRPRRRRPGRGDGRRPRAPRRRRRGGCPPLGARAHRARPAARRPGRPHARRAWSSLRRQEAAAAHAASAGSTGGGGHLSTAGYANGQIPASRLQPLAGTHGAHRLQAPAATAFDAMSRAYRAQFGAPIAITDSYRSLPQQVEPEAAQGRVGRDPGHQRARLGPGGRPRRRRRVLRQRAAPLDAAARAGLRLRAPRLGP
ncbi:hypothetical protein GCM10025868_31410 [Angustibacter aerolatus]|uniref:Peptidase M15B domain-containing protein n=1 Tax=Angustibacter aerolatus TaxID=1162965 RepID=A0ABQ6JME6_9ACTN|nr:hypothetical protein [Angustibacter aerolatus]GMA87891.1 hypothetical protein GCM10025868_31410 [Angustibacter aerolatus]